MSLGNISSINNKTYMQRKKILITGASGFIGGFLVDEALDRGYEVWAGIRIGSNKRNLLGKGVYFIYLPYEDEQELTECVRKHSVSWGAWDYVIHNAGVTKTSKKEEFYEVNAEYTKRLFKALGTCAVPEKFILMSSLSSYGCKDEKQYTPIKIDDIQNPNTEYGKSKLKAEKYVKQQSEISYIILKPTGVYGPGEKDYLNEIKSINSGIDCSIGYKPQQLTFIYVKDLARICFDAIENQNIRNKEYLLSDGDVYTDREFAADIQELTGRKFVLHLRLPVFLVYIACLISEIASRLFRFNTMFNTDKYKILKQRNWKCDITPVCEDLGFVPRYKLKKGLKESIEWYKDKKWL